MIYRILADVTVIVHFAFILFVLAGGFAVSRYPRLIWLHLPAALWGALLEFQGWICPLTPLEQALRARAGEAGYSGGFVAHYLYGLIYPLGLTTDIQIALGVLVVAVNLTVYLRIWRRRLQRRTAGS